MELKSTHISAAFFGRVLVVSFAMANPLRIELDMHNVWFTSTVVSKQDGSKSTKVEAGRRRVSRREAGGWS
jgi:hypothetical protein